MYNCIRAQFVFIQPHAALSAGSTCSWPRSRHRPGAVAGLWDRVSVKCSWTGSEALDCRKLWPPAVGVGAVRGRLQRDENGVGDEST